MLRQPREGTTVLEYNRQLVGAFPLVEANRIAITTKPITTVQSARHGLGRAYRGVVGPTSQSAAAAFTWLPASAQAEPETYVYFTQSVAAAIDVEAWVY
jgi:hypothetical protein